MTTPPQVNWVPGTVTVSWFPTDILASTMSEAALSEAVIDCAHALNWSCAHFRSARTKDGWRTPVAADAAGFPDLVLVRTRVVFVELKTERGVVSRFQRHWLERLDAAHADYHLWRPSDWCSGEIERELRRVA